MWTVSPSPAADWKAVSAAASTIARSSAAVRPSVRSASASRSRSPDGRIEVLEVVGGGDDDQVVQVTVGFEGLQQLVDGAALLGMGTGATALGDGVELVEEQDAGTVGSSDLEGALDVVRGLTHDTADEVPGRQVEEVGPELPCQAPHEVRLPGAGWTVQQHPVPFDPVLGGAVGVGEDEPEAVPQLLFELGHASDVREGGQLAGRDEWHRRPSRRGHDRGLRRASVGVGGGRSGAGGPRLPGDLVVGDAGTTELGQEPLEVLSPLQPLEPGALACVRDRTGHEHADEHEPDHDLHGTLPPRRSLGRRQEAPSASQSSSIGTGEPVAIPFLTYPSVS